MCTAKLQQDQLRRFILSSLFQHMSFSLLNQQSYISFQNRMKGFPFFSLDCGNGAVILCNGAFGTGNMGNIHGHMEICIRWLKVCQLMMQLVEGVPLLPPSLSYVPCLCTTSSYTPRSTLKRYPLKPMDIKTIVSQCQEGRALHRGPGKPAVIA